MRALALIPILALATPAIAAPHHEHGGSVGYRHTGIHATSRDVSLHGVALAYSVHVGNTASFVGQFGLCLPISGSEDQQAVDLLQAYQGRTCLDMTAGFGWRFELPRGVDLIPAIGWHLDYTNLGSAELKDFQHLATGLSLLLKASWDTGRGVTLGGTFSVAFDMIDLLHGGDLNLSVVVTPVFTVGYRFGRPADEEGA